MMAKSAHSAQIHPTKQQPNQLTMQPTDLPCKWINDFHSLSWHIKKAAMPPKGFVVWLLSGTSSKFWQIESGWVGPDRPQRAEIRHSQPIQPFLVSCQLFAPNGGGDVPILWLFFWLNLPPCILVAAQCMSANDGSPFPLREGVKKKPYLFGTLSQTSDPTHPLRTFGTQLSEK